MTTTEYLTEINLSDIKCQPFWHEVTYANTLTTI